MKVYKEIKTIITNHYEFDEKVNKWVEKFQKKGYQVEIDYQPVMSNIDHTVIRTCMVKGYIHSEV